ncbi:MAG: response regulator [Planctomycetes bacterium]|nr:response regulator [Planctomycetota bacterium]
MPSILIVDDEPVITKLFTDLLSPLPDYQIRTAPNGRAALDEIRREVPDLVIADIYMPEMDGFELIEALDEMRINVPVIVISGKATDEDEQRVQDLGIVQFLPKPIGIGALQEAIDMALGQAKMERRHQPRFQTRLVVQHVVQEGDKKATYESETVNCSVGGLCFKWYLPFGRLFASHRALRLVGEGAHRPIIFNLKIYDPHNKTRYVMTRARFVHYTRLPEQDFDYIGAKFVDLDEESRKQLLELLGHSGPELSPQA